MLPESLIRFSQALQNFPGIGKRSSQKLAMDMLELDEKDYGELLSSLDDARQKINFCSISGVFCEGETSPMLTDPSRNTNQICLVERPVDVVAFERGDVYTGNYHVLGKLISPLEGVFAEDTNIPKLFERLADTDENIELIIFLKDCFETDATVAYIRENLINSKLSERVTISRLAQGLPLYFNSDSLDSATIVKALEDRRVAV